RGRFAESPEERDCGGRQGTARRCSQRGCGRVKRKTPWRRSLRQGIVLLSHHFSCRTVPPRRRVVSSIRLVTSDLRLSGRFFTIISPTTLAAVPRARPLS